MLQTIAGFSRARLSAPSTSIVSPATASRIGSVRYKRYSAFDAELDKDTLAVARKWHESFDSSQLPAGSTTYARSSGPGGQHVNKTETKAISVFPVKDILAVIPPILHPSIRMSPYYTAGTDALTFQAQSHRSRTANAEENRKKLVSIINQLYDEKVPAETGSDKHAKYKEVAKRFHDSRLKDKKVKSSKKQSRRGGDE
ncbi:hypothetical protein NLG97_g9429 [Lecanicillium saksenae]|uniref:Uncharacterized protein n=1 Tax=Lecanicillium saksenae TaxID=468837 RepID=A0ACC1QHR0_9HYPO|nr:hypothetical protein NLG97_g9429 [Lecanicillium saksenae]